MALSYNNIGVLLSVTAKPAEALEAHAKALAIWQRLADADSKNPEIQRDLAGSHTNIGNLLWATGKPAESLKALEKALVIRQKLFDANPTVTAFMFDLATSQTNIANLLSATGKPSEAHNFYDSAILIRQKLADANPTVPKFRGDVAGSHINTGNLLRDIGKTAEALKSYESALTICQALALEHPESPDFASDLGATLNNLATIDIRGRRFENARDRLRQAVESQSKALATNPMNPNYRQFLDNHLVNLISALQGLSDSAGAAEAERDLAKLRDSDPAKAALDARLAGIIKGHQQSTDEVERLALAKRAYDKTLHATSARFWAEALAADPGLGDNRQTQHRYNAACSAALAGSGKGSDDPPPDNATKAKLRRHALDWLKAELGAWSKIVDSGPPQARPFVASTLKHWQEDIDLAGIRDTQELAKLSDEERATFKQLWNDVEALAAKLESRN